MIFGKIPSGCFRGAFPLGDIHSIGLGYFVSIVRMHLFTMHCVVVQIILHEMTDRYEISCTNPG